MSEDTLKNPEQEAGSVVIEAAKPDDAEAIFNVRKQTWIATYPNQLEGITEEDIRIAVEGPNGELALEKIARLRRGIETGSTTWKTFVAKRDSEVVGFVAPSIIEGQHRVGAIYVLPTAQNDGIGGKLLAKAIAWHGKDNDMFLHVATYNEPAIRFYEKHGFVKTGKGATDPAGQLPSGKVIPELEMLLAAQQA